MSSDSVFLDAAAAIGRTIVADAVWHDGRCTWMGATTDPRHPWLLKYRALGPRVYEGAAGVALYLAQLAVVTGDAAPRRTAIGALRHALATAPTLPPPDRDGLQAGLVGVALAAIRVAEWLDEPELDAGGRALLTLPAGAGNCPDVMMGSAGTIIGLLAIGEAERAVAAGEELLERATVRARGWSWASPGHRQVVGITHGAGGIGWAMLELFAATGAERFRDAALGAFAYERSWLDAASGTWPDLRVAQARGSAITGTWCRGEGGIAMTRLRAAALLGSEAERRDAEFALATTRRHLSNLLAHEVEDLSLCHGAAGTAEVLLSAGAPAPEAVALGARAVARYGDGREPWPCGVRNGVTPGLFLGLGGIGWWLLRLHDAQVPSPLDTWG